MYHNIFSRKSDSRIANVRLPVNPSISHQNPSASQNCSYRPSGLSTIRPIDHQAYWPSSLLTIKPINHRAYWPLSLSTIEPANHWAYRPSSLLTIEPIDHQAYRPSSLLTIKPINNQAYWLTSGLLSRLLSLSACLETKVNILPIFNIISKKSQKALK